MCKNKSRNDPIIFPRHKPSLNIYYFGYELSFLKNDFKNLTNIDVASQTDSISLIHDPLSENA